MAINGLIWLKSLWIIFHSKCIAYTKRCTFYLFTTLNMYCKHLGRTHRYCIFTIFCRVEVEDSYLRTSCINIISFFHCQNGGCTHTIGLMFTAFNIYIYKSPYMAVGLFPAGFFPAVFSPLGLFPAGVCREKFFRSSYRKLNFALCKNISGDLM